ncbi:MAG: LytR cell envelope-related transcriptional attenuator [Solirubrobacteraceae bacterium]|nr:LytR cell envelope-related transcriptional attenuator [Solirubrobacteraceae bacterium]
MTDFYTQLEEQLLVAGRRRESQSRAGLALAGRGRQVAGATALVAAIAAGVVIAAPGGGGAPPEQAPARAAPPPAAASPAPGSLRGIRVLVLDGTPRPGVARTVAGDLRRLQASIRGLRNAPGRAVQQTSVRYAPGRRAQARRVAAALGVADVGPASASAAIAGTVDVTVVVGTDVRRRPPVVPARPAATPATPVPARPGGAPVTPVPVRPGGAPVAPAPARPGAAPATPLPVRPGGAPVTPAAPAP